LLVPPGHVDVGVVQPHAEIDPPGARGGVGHEGDVPAFVAPLSGGRAGTTLVMDVEPGDAGQSYELGEQADEVRQPEPGGHEDHDIEIAPDHQTGDVAARVLHRAGPG